MERKQFRITKLKKMKIKEFFVNFILNQMYMYHVK